MKVSLLFISYNHRLYVAEAIRSAMAQDCSDFELVVCDDRSTDGTRGILEDELRRCPPHITVVRAHSEQNVGLIANFNRGMAACTGEIIIPMSGDDISLPFRVSNLVKEFNDHPDCMLICSNWQCIDENNNFIQSSCKKTKKFVFSYQGKIKNIYAGSPVCGAAAAYRAILRDLYGAMQPYYQSEDNCYWVRALLTGKIHYLPRALIYWRVHRTNLSNAVRTDDNEQARKKHLKFLRVSRYCSYQWARDIGLAVQNSLITPDLALRLSKIIQLDNELARIRRYSLMVTPWRLWLGSASQVFKLDASPRCLRRVLFSQLKMRLLVRRRTSYWSRYFAAR